MTFIIKNDYKTIINTNIICVRKVSIIFNKKSEKYKQHPVECNYIHFDPAKDARVKRIIHLHRLSPSYKFKAQ